MEQQQELETDNTRQLEQLKSCVYKIDRCLEVCEEKTEQGNLNEVTCEFVNRNLTLLKKHECIENSEVTTSITIVEDVSNEKVVMKELPGSIKSLFESNNVNKCIEEEVVRRRNE